jgi:hypothetical protein
MARHQVTLTSNGAPQKICDIIRQNHPTWVGEVHISGNFASTGVVSISVSPDNGTTRNPIPQPSGSPIASAVSFGVGPFGGHSQKGDQCASLWAELTGAGLSPSVNVVLFSNQNDI